MDTQDETTRPHRRVGRVLVVLAVAAIPVVVARVIAVNVVGAGAPSAAVSAVPAGATPVTPPPSTGTCATRSAVPGGGDPFGGCWPGPQNTGVPVGVVLTTYTGPCTITVANTVIDSKIITCDIDVRATGVVIRRSEIHGYVSGPDQQVTPFSFRVEDSFIDGSPNGPRGAAFGGLCQFHDRAFRGGRWAGWHLVCAQLHDPGHVGAWHGPLSDLSLLVGMRRRSGWSSTARCSTTRSRATGRHLTTTSMSAVRLT